MQKLVAETLVPSHTSLAPLQQLQGWLEAATKAGLPLAVWRQPHQATKHLVVSFTPEIKQVEPDLEELAPGFLAHPFASDDKTGAYYLPADLYWNTGLESPNLTPGTEEAVGPFWELAEAAMANPAFRPLDFHPNPKPPTNKEQCEETHYVQLVNEGIKAIKAGHFQKVVPSRTKRVTLPEQFQMVQTFHELCERYPNAFVSLVSIPQVGTWLGATPEVLITVKDRRYFNTVALAGTQRWDLDRDLDDAAWRGKEIEEQALVSRYIINCFKKIRLREFDEQGPRTSRAGNLIHLKTDFKVDMQATNFPQLGTVMLKLLHPTSAVCGMPKESAENFLLAQEGYNREFYAGYLGPVNVQSLTSLYVNLRCMQWLGREALLYAGAGVTADSKPQKEWEETELKCNTLLSVIQGTNTEAQ